MGMPLLASKHGAEVDRLIFYIHALMAALFVGWLGYFFLTLIKFRKSANPKASYLGVTSHFSSYLEGFVAIIEAVLLIGFAVPMWAHMADGFPKDSDATVIRVTAEQFAWNARYPGRDGKFGQQDINLAGTSNPLGYDPKDPASKDDIIPPLNEMTVPLGKPVIAYITSKDVIHSFKILPFRVTQDAIPGLVIPLWFEPTKAGRYILNCAQLCGNSHYFMRGTFNVVSPADYEAWVTEKSKAGSGPVSFE